MLSQYVSTSLVQVTLVICAGIWFTNVNQVVPEPYLDEVFHIRQATAYWRNQWQIWDPKITTPPGLYIVSYILLGPLRLVPDLAIGPLALRFTNILALTVFLPYILEQILVLNGTKKSASGKSSFEIAHTILNICLFPPIFFFSALYYTDILSACSVLYSYVFFLKYPYGRSKGHSLRIGTICLSGLWSLWFRQTNIFWVAIFSAGLEVLRTLREEENVHNPEVGTASLTGRTPRNCPSALTDEYLDYFSTSLSIGLVAIRKLMTILQAVTPYVVILAAFGTFVIWNGSVVLGHKEFHTASLHLPQMLYIWPYFMFFSFPLVIPYFLNAFVPQQLLPIFCRTGSLSSRLPRIGVSVSIICCMMLVIHFNTIVHPFTLADNRHYVFYIFRILLKNEVTKYGAVIVYFICGWASIAALGGIPRLANDDGRTKMAEPATTDPKVKRAATSIDNESNTVGFVIVWLVSTALSLVTAPLVEPRYFIVPWMIWRLHVPIHHQQLLPGKTHVGQKKNPTSTPASEGFIRTHDYRLWVETAWYLTVNVVTARIFLAWGFSWPQEPGQVQRFLW
ncbi:MAG: glucosyltransferase [Cirrosporium novae-zelandiae]|nr:MAG: glucosyltransferase [Cirrosporium novae-zelandiae]